MVNNVHKLNLKTFYAPVHCTLDLGVSKTKTKKPKN